MYRIPVGMLATDLFATVMSFSTRYFAFYRPPPPPPSFPSATPRYGGAITAALYLDEFVGTKKDTPEGEEGGSREQKVPWIHMDFMAFNQASRAGRPEGGEAQGMRALYSLLEVMFMSK